MATYISRSVSSRVAPVATQPGKSGEYAEKFWPAVSITIRKRCMLLSFEARLLQNAVVRAPENECETDRPSPHNSNRCVGGCYNPDDVRQFRNEWRSRRRCVAAASTAARPGRGRDGSRSGAARFAQPASGPGRTFNAELA